MNRNTEFIEGCLDDAFSVCSQCHLPVRNAFDSIDQLSEILSLDDNQMIGEEVSPKFVRDQLVGRKLGVFQIQERIGSGGMARVYLALDTILKRHVAVKVIQNKKYVTKESQAQLLQSEAISQASLHHPNVVSIFYVGTHDEFPFLAMEYVDGLSLSDRIKDGPLSFEKVKKYATQIVSGLSEAYRNGLIHGDIKPANLLVDDDDVIKLSDFGLARHLHDDNYVPKQLVGTPSFMAPELFDKHGIDEQTDLFSLGVTLFQATFGHSPYKLIGETAEELKLCLENTKIDFPKDCKNIPVFWIEILKRLLAISRSERYQSIGELEKDLQFPSRQPAPAKRIPKLTSLVVDNLSLLLLAIPAIVYANVGAIKGSFADQVGWFWMIGPVAWWAISVLRKRSIGNLMTHSSAVNSTTNPSRMAYAVYQSILLMPAILLSGGLMTVSVLGASFGLTWISLGLAIMVCFLVEVAVKKRPQTFAERVCQTQLIVDV